MIKDIELIFGKPLNKIKFYENNTNLHLYFNKILNLIKTKKFICNWSVDNDIVKVNYNNFNCAFKYNQYSLGLLVDRIKKNKSAFIHLVGEKIKVKKYRVKKVKQANNLNGLYLTKMKENNHYYIKISHFDFGHIINIPLSNKLQYTEAVKGVRLTLSQFNFMQPSAKIKELRTEIINKLTNIFEPEIINGQKNGLGLLKKSKPEKKKSIIYKKTQKKTNKSEFVPFLEHKKQLLAQYSI